MKNRLLSKIHSVQRSGGKLFCAFLTLGYPSLDATEKLALEFEKAGVDILELGFPFSDPLADGPTIQFASDQAIGNGVRFRDAFRMVRGLREKGFRIPVVFFSYLNPVFHFGFKPFVRLAKESGFDGLIVPDMPPEEEKDFGRECRRLGLAQTFLVAPTTEKKRAHAIARKSEGFIYYVSLRGVTGARRAVPSGIRDAIQDLRGFVKKPVLVGFGVSTPEQAKVFSAMSEGVIVGSAIIDHLRSSRGDIGPAVKYVQKMVRAVKGSS